jgi:hypothetical protein
MYDDTPGGCLDQVLLARRVLERGLADRDTLPGVHIADTLPPSVRTAGLRCAARFPIASVAPRELRNAFELAVLLNDSVASAAALERWLALPQQTLTDRDESLSTTRAKRLEQAIRVYMNPDRAGPQLARDTVRARTLFSQLDALGPSVRDKRLAVQWFMLRTNFAWASAGLGAEDDHRVFHDLSALLAGLDSAGQPGSSLLQEIGPDVALRLLEAKYFLDPDNWSTYADSLVQSQPQASRPLYALMVSRVKPIVLQKNMPVAPLTAQFWYSATGDSVWPVPGHVSLLIRDRIGTMSVADAASIRRLVQRYGPRGLRVALVLETLGSWTKGGTETGPRTAAQEAAQDSAFYLGYLGLPVTLAIRESSFSHEATGHIVRTPHPYPMGPGILLADANGRMIVNFRLDDATLDKYLERAMVRKQH